MTPAKSSGPALPAAGGAPAKGARKRPPGSDGKGSGCAPQRGSSGNTKPSQPTAAPQWPSRPAVDVHDPDGVRLQKLLAAAGVGSRRVCEDLITQGRVEVDGQVVTELGVRIRPTQTVHVDGVRIQLDESRVYLAFNKPLGVVTSMSDELGRVDIGDFVANRKERLFHVGRLDADTEGLLLLTNDGDLAHRLQHPRYGVLKTYLARRSRVRSRGTWADALREGIELEDGPVAVDSFKVVDSRPGKALVEIVLHEGRKHIVRRVLAEVGHPVITLVRTQVGPIHLAETKPGKWRNLTSAEVGASTRRPGCDPRPRRRHRTRDEPGPEPPRDDVTLEDVSPTQVALARDLGAGWLPDGPLEPDLVVVATPPDVTASCVADALRRWPGAAVTDVASVKGVVLEELRADGAELRRYRGSHPMAGRERSGAVLRVVTTCSTVEPGAHPHDRHRARGRRARLRGRPLCRGGRRACWPQSATTQRSPSCRTCRSWPRASSPGSKGSTTPPSAWPAGPRDVTRIAASDPTLWTQILAATPPPSPRCSRSSSRTSRWCSEPSTSWGTPRTPRCARGILAKAIAAGNAGHAHSRQARRRPHGVHDRARPHPRRARAAGPPLRRHRVDRHEHRGVPPRPRARPVVRGGRGRRRPQAAAGLASALEGGAGGCTAEPPLGSRPMTAPLTIAIDGPSGSGKSSVSRAWPGGSGSGTWTPVPCTAP